MERVFLPYIAGTGKPIPYLFEQITPYMDASRFEFTILRADEDRVIDCQNVHEIYYPEARPWWRKVRYVRTAVDSYDLVHTGGRPSTHLPIARIVHTRSPEVKHVHSLRVDVDTESEKPTAKKRQLVGMADVVTAVSKHTAQTAEAEFGIRPHVIHNGVDTGVFRPDYESPPLFDDLGFDRGQPVFLTVGTLCARKRPADVLRVARACPEYEFVLVGDGPLWADLRTEAEPLDNVHLVGRLPKAQLPPVYAHATGFLFPSIREGCANVVLETMAAATPVVGYRATSMPELVTDGETGYLAELADIQGLIEGVCAVADGDGRLGEHAREHVMEHHSFSAIAASYERLYRTLLAD